MEVHVLITLTDPADSPGRREDRRPKRVPTAMSHRALRLVPKPAAYIQVESLANITMSRVGGGFPASRPFDIAGEE